VQKADADFVVEKTGYVIGGVSPVGLPDNIKILLDTDLFVFTEIWAAAGTSKSVFKLTPNILREITNGTMVDIKVD
jgi:prolyl-tRNA editing enzyme YbaK/EbsC (Cys-tRNA(Pro) deacylase)